MSTTVATFVVTSALSIGFSLVASLLQPQQGQGALDSGNLSDSSNPQSVQITERQSIPNKRVIVGGAYVGGALFAELATPPYLTVGILVNEGQITGFDSVTIGTDKLSFSGGIVPNTILSPAAVNNQPAYHDNLRVSVRYGTDDQAVDPLILADYPDIGAEFRQRGIATAVLRYHYGGTDNSAATQAAHVALWGQVARPNAYFYVKGVPVYDPRDATQSLSDESTWRWTNNATLVQAYYLTREWGGRIPVGKIDWTRIAESADYDDSAMACADGTRIARHTIDGVITLNQRPYDVMQSLLTANRGRVLIGSDKIWIGSSKPKDPIATIHDGLLAGGIKYQASKAKRDLVNKCQVRFVAPEQDYQIVDGPVLSRTDLQTLDQEVLPATLALNYTQDHRRAQRLQKAFLESARLGRTITCTVDLSILGMTADELLDGIVTFSSELFSQANGRYRVASIGFAEDFTTVSLALTEDDPTIETNWNPDEDEQEFTLTEFDV